MKTLFLMLALMFVLIFLGTNHVYAQYGCPAVSGGWHPKMVANQNHVYVAWNYFFGCGQRELFLKESSDYGNTFGDSVKVADTSQTGSDPTVAVAGNTVYLAWIHYLPNSEDVLFRMSAYNGTNFGNIVQISENKTGESQVYKILVSGNNVGILWTGYLLDGSGSRVFLSKSTNGGQSFEPPISLSGTTGDSFYPQVVQANDKAYVVWSSFGSCDQSRQTCISQSYFTTLDIANNFSQGQMVSLGHLGMRLAVSGNNVYVAGMSGTSTSPNSGPNEITLIRSTNDGAYFEKPTTVIYYPSPATDHLNGVSLDVSQNHVYVTWYDFHSPLLGGEILMKASNDNGTTFGNTHVVDPVDFHLNGPAPPDFDLMTSSSGNAYYATWQSNTNLDPVGEGVFLRKSTDGGNTFVNAIDLSGKIVISNPGYDFISDGNSLYITGPDYGFQDGNHVVFSKSNDGGNSFSNQIDFDQNTVSTVPEFSFAIPILLVSIASLIVFYRTRIEK